MTAVVCDVLPNICPTSREEFYYWWLPCIVAIVFVLGLKKLADWRLGPSDPLHPKHDEWCREQWRNAPDPFDELYEKDESTATDRMPRSVSDVPSADDPAR